MAYSYAHMCRDEHVQIGHNDSEHEQCPLCRVRNALRFLIEEITDREGREGMTDYDFAEQVIALAHDQRAILSADADRPSVSE